MKEILRICTRHVPWWISNGGTETASILSLEYIWKLQRPMEEVMTRP